MYFFLLLHEPFLFPTHELDFIYVHIVFDPNFTDLTNTNLKCPILYNKSQPDLTLTSLQKIPLSPILPSSTTKSLLPTYSPVFLQVLHPHAKFT